MNKELIYQKIRNYFQDKPVRKVAVFGSYARSSQRDDSDIDILITMLAPVGLLTLSGYQIELQKLLGIRVDLGTEQGVSPIVKPFIEKDLEIVYEKK